MKPSFYILIILPCLLSSAFALEKATFCGGCFWCMEGPFEKLEGVTSVISGYSGGKEPSPSYKQVSSGSTSHREAVQITFDPKKISYKELLEVYWKTFDPTDSGGQFADRGFQYSSAIFHHGENQKSLALESKKKLSQSKKFKKPIVTPILEYRNFYPAEDYHQDYYKKNPGHYQGYRKGSGREGFLKRVWGTTK